MTIRYKNAKTDLTTTNATAVLTPDNATTAVIKSILVQSTTSFYPTIVEDFKKKHWN